MKRLFCMLLVALMLASAGFAEDNSVYVTISNADGSLVMAYEEVALSDADGDGALTIYDALYLAHEQSFEGGAQAGFLAEDQGYGLSLCMLWGDENGSSYGYFVNNASAISLLDPIAAGDHVKAFAYTDLETWSDTYCYFDQATAAESELSLSLTALVYDADWNLNPMSVEGAVITVDGVDAAVTDAEGKAAISIAEAGKHIVSAYSDAMVLVPPVCVVNIDPAS